jgi:hypothetical protein
MTMNAHKRSVWLGTLGLIFITNFIACKKKDDPATANAGGNVAAKQDQLTIASAVVKFSEVRASMSSDCSNPVNVGIPTAIPTNATVTGLIPDGTYHCLMFHISDQVPVTPPAAAGCLPLTVDIFQGNDDTTSAPGGASVKATIAPGTDDHPWVYFSDSSLAQSGNNCFEPGPTPNGCACSVPCQMPAFVISSAQARKLVFNFDNRLSSATACTPQLPSVPVIGSSLMTITP